MDCVTVKMDLLLNVATVKIWYLNGVELTEEEFKKKTSKEIVLTMDEIAEKLGIEVSKLKIKK